LLHAYDTRARKRLAATVERLRKARGQSVEALVNDALREGLKSLARRSPAGGRLETRSVDLGRCLVHDVDDAAGAIAGAESESFR
jgi:hypothetical protein